MTTNPDNQQPKSSEGAPFLLHVTESTPALSQQPDNELEKFLQFYLDPNCDYEVAKKEFLAWRDKAVIDRLSKLSASAKEHHDYLLPRSEILQELAQLKGGSND